MAERMTERLRRAVCCDDGNDTPHEKCYANNSVNSRIVANVLRALRDPTPEMVEAMATFADENGWPDVVNEELINLYRAAIDAAGKDHG